MSGITFSLTERFIIDPVLHLRSPLLADPENPVGIKAKILQFAKAEIVARVTALFTSVFTAVDAFVHLLAGVYKGGYLLLRKLCKITPASWNKSEVQAHFRRAAFFAAATVVGSVAGTIWPGLFKHCRYTPPFTQNYSSEVPEALQKLATDVNERALKQSFYEVIGKTSLMDDLLHFWNHSLSNKQWFVQVFNGDNEKFKKLRELMADIVYRPIKPSTSLKDKEVKWLSPNEITPNIYTQAFFFHATSEKSLESILKSKKIEVRHEKTFKGAFVSTKPEGDYGPCILAFRRNIERLSPLEHGFLANQSTYWAGFSRDIPVNDSTLAYIILSNDNYQKKNELETSCEQWAGRKISVISYDDVKKTLKNVADLNMGIPKEWPSDDEDAGQQILNTLKLTIPQQNIERHKATVTHPKRRSNKQLLAVNYV